MIELLNIRNGKVHLGYWVDLLGFANGGYYLTACASTQSKSGFSLIPRMQHFENAKTQRCLKCFGK